MTTLKEGAIAYEKKTTKNISDLTEVNVDVLIVSKVYKEGTPDEYTIDVIEKDGEDYRVPPSVLGALQSMLLDKRTMNMKKFMVNRTGTTQTDTKYSVVPLGL